MVLNYINNSENNKIIHEHTNEYKITNYNDFDINMLRE